MLLVFGLLLAGSSTELSDAVVADACAGVEEASHRKTLDVLAPCFASRYGVA